MLYNNNSNKPEQHQHAHSHADAPESPTADITHSDSLIWQIQGMDCASCARKIEQAVKQIANVQQVRTTFTTQKLVVNLVDPNQTHTAAEIEKQVQALGYQLTRQQQGESHQHAHNHTIDRRAIISLLLIAVLMVISYLLNQFNPTYGTIGFTITTLLGLWPILRKAIMLMKNGSIFTIELLMSISAIGALAIQATEEASMVLFLFMIGEMLEAFAASRAKKGIASLAQLMPETAVKIGADGERQTVASNTLQPDDVIEAASGTRLPADVELLDDLANIDESALTGESIPVEYRQGAKIMAGAMVVDKTVRLKVLSKQGQNAVDRILQMIEQAEERKAPIERFIDTFSRYYTPAIALLALLVMILPPLVAGQAWYPWFYKGLALLLIGCPCALVISTPASITSALSAAARQGVLIKGGAAIEALGAIQTIALDKTGTLTEGKPQVTDLVQFAADEAQLLSLAAAVETGSHHPLAKAIVEYANAQQLTIPPAQQLQALAGIGVQGQVEQQLIQLIAPNKAAQLAIKLTQDQQQQVLALEQQGKTVILVVADQQLLGLIALRDQLRAEAAQAIAELKQLNIKPIMLTGDNARAAKAIADQLQIDYRAELLPADKLKLIESLAADGHTAMIGDGINDSPALKAASVGIAMGSGTDVALETADAALSKNNLRNVPQLIKLARRTNRNIRQNITLALAIKALFLITTLFGVTNLWMAVLADSGTTAIVTANALRLLRIKK